MQDFLNTILNPAKLPDTPTGIWNHGPESLERLIERHADASKEESLIDVDGARNSFIQFKHFRNTGSNKDQTPTEINFVKFLQSQVFMKTYSYCVVTC